MEEVVVVVRPSHEKYALVLNFTQGSVTRHITGAVVLGLEEAIWSLVRREPE